MSAAEKTTGISDILDRINELPTLPEIIYEIRAVIDNPMSSIADVEKVMHNDPVLTTKVLKLVNSAYYSIPGGVTQLSRAIGYLGFDTVHQLVLSATIIDSLKSLPDGSFKMSELWKHSLGTGIASESIGHFINYPLPADLFTCGLVHDIGKIALLVIEPELMQNIVTEANQKNITYLEAELKLGIPSHTHIGCLLAQRWKLPLGFQKVIKYHHQKEILQRESLPNDINQMVDIVCLGNLLCHAMKFGDSGHPIIDGAPTALLKRLGIDPKEGFKSLLQSVKKQMQQADGFLEILGVSA